MSKLIYVYFVAGVLMCAGVAGAQSSTQASAADEQAAREHFERGKAHYVLRAYDKAAVEYVKAYELIKKPLLLYNVAQAYRLAGDLARAVEYYERYVTASPDGVGAANARTLIAELREEIKVRDALAKVSAASPGVQVELLPAPGAGAGDARVFAAPDERGRDGVEWRFSPWVPWTIVGAGVAVGLSGLVWQQKSAASFDEYDLWIAENCPGGCADESLPHDVRERGTLQKNLALSSYIVGGVVAATGLVMLSMNRPRVRRADAFSLHVAPGLSGPVVTMDLRF